MELVCVFAVDDLPEEVGGGESEEEEVVLELDLVVVGKEGEADVEDDLAVVVPGLPLCLVAVDEDDGDLVLVGLGQDGQFELEVVEHVAGQLDLLLRELGGS